MSRVAFLALLVLVAVGCARSGDVVPRAERQFQLDWRLEQEPSGAVVRGHLLNPHAVPARDIHLLVEGLDAAGLVVTKTTSVVRRIVLSGDRVPFDVPVPAAADYRVTVVAFDLVLPRGGR